jgi:hypothetical protein
MTNVILKEDSDHLLQENGQDILIAEELPVPQAKVYVRIAVDRASTY